MDWSKSCLPMRSFFEAVRVNRHMQLVLLLNGGACVIALTIFLLGFSNFRTVAVPMTLIGSVGIIALAMIYKDARYSCSLVPLFEKPVGGIDTFDAGIALVHNMVNLEVLASANQARILTDFHSLTDINEEPNWFDSAEGLNTIRAMIRGLAEELYVPPKIRKTIEADLRRWETALERAAERGIRFAVFFRHDYSTELINSKFGSVV